MANGDKPKQKRPPFLRLKEIEDEGHHAAHQRASELFARCMKMGGRIDWPALRTGGPAVHRAFLALVSSQAAATSSSKAIIEDAVGKADPAKAKTSSVRGSSKRTLPRIEKNWGHRRTPALDFRWQAFRGGVVITTAVCIIAFLIIRWFGL